MRKFSVLIAACALGLSAQACTLTIPGGLAGGLINVTPDGKAVPGGKPASPAPSASPATACDQDFNRYDKDRNGSWNLAEYSAYFGTLPQTMIACLDPNDSTKTITCPQHDPNVMFKKADKNGDGKITRDEQCAAQSPPFPGDPNVPVTNGPPGTSVGSPPQPGGTPGSVPGMPPTRFPWSVCEDTLHRADTNGDFLVDFDEFIQADYREPLPPGMAGAAVMPSPEQQKEYFIKKDRDGDGFLDGGEMCGIPPTYLPPRPKPSPAPTLDPKPTPTPDRPVDEACMKNFVTWDLNKDGALSYEEYTEGKWSQIRFIRAPSDEEVQNMKESFRVEANKLDSNQDKKLTTSEFAATCVQDQPQ